ncbi:MAG: BrnT family toxin [Anaerolineae bacterium]
MALLTPQWQALTPTPRQAFEIAVTLPFIRRYYLEGGTGLALHLGHRFSVDLDFFSDRTTIAPRLALLYNSDDSAATVFNDPLSVTVPDPDHSTEEDRLIIVGRSHRRRLLIVSFAERGDRVRIISARRLTRTESRAYEREYHE